MGGEEPTSQEKKQRAEKDSTTPHHASYNSQKRTNLVTEQK